MIAALLEENKRQTESLYDFLKFAHNQVKTQGMSNFSEGDFAKLIGKFSARHKASEVLVKEITSKSQKVSKDEQKASTNQQNLFSSTLSRADSEELRSVANALVQSHSMPKDFNDFVDPLPKSDDRKNIFQKIIDYIYEKVFCTQRQSKKLDFDDKRQSKKLKKFTQGVVQSRLGGKATQHKL